MRADPRVEADAVDDGLGVQPFHLGIGVKFVEVADTQGQVGVGKELHGLSLGQSHKQGVNILLDGSFLQQLSKNMGSLVEALIAFRTAYDDSTGVEIVVESLALTEKFRCKNDIVTAVFLSASPAR